MAYRLAKLEAHSKPHLAQRITLGRLVKAQLGSGHFHGSVGKLFELFSADDGGDSDDPF